MATSRQIIEVVYSILADNNLSRLLPVLDEQIVIHIPDSTPLGGKYQGRSGFLSMMSKVYEICDNLSVNSLVYFKSDDELSQDAIITMGILEGQLLIDKKKAVLPFIHYWQLSGEKVVGLRAFSWDSASVLNRLQWEKQRSNRPSNGHRKSANGNGSD